MTQLQSIIVAYASEFMKATGASLDPRVYMALVREEFAELKEAYRGDDEAHQMKELIDLLLVLNSLDAVTPDDLTKVMPDEEVVEAIQLMGDVINLLESIEDTVDINVAMEAALRVHQSNMSKVLDDGTTLRRADGKIMKGPNYKAPDLSDLF